MLLVAALTGGALVVQVRGIRRGDPELRLPHTTIRSRPGQIAYAALTALIGALALLFAFVG